MTIDSFITKQPLPLFTGPWCWSWIKTGYKLRKMSCSMAQRSSIARKATYLLRQGEKTLLWLTGRHVVLMWETDDPRGDCAGRSPSWNHFQQHKLLFYILTCCDMTEKRLHHGNNDSFKTPGTGWWLFKSIFLLSSLLIGNWWLDNLHV